MNGPSAETRAVERERTLFERYLAVKACVHAIDHPTTGNRVWSELGAVQLLRDGIINALDGRSTGREYRTIRHTYRNGRDGPIPPAISGDDQRCQECGAVGYGPCAEHRFLSRESKAYAAPTPEAVIERLLGRIEVGLHLAKALEETRKEICNIHQRADSRQFESVMNCCGLALTGIDIALAHYRAAQKTQEQS